MDLLRLNNRMLNPDDKRGPWPNARPLAVLGTIAAAQRPQPVAWLARDMGANRQNVQRIVNDLEKEGLVTFETNPHHRRAQTRRPNGKGKQTFETAMRLQAPWVNRLSEGLKVEDIETTHTVIKTLRS